MVFKWHKKSKLTKTERAIKTRGALILLVSRYTHHIYMKNNPMTVISVSCLHNEHEMHTEICEIQLAYIFYKMRLIFPKKLLKEVLGYFFNVCLILPVWQNSEMSHNDYSKLLQLYMKSLKLAFCFLQLFNTDGSSTVFISCRAMK